MNKPRVFYQDRSFTVTGADLKTRTVIYPINESITGRLRKDIQFGALGLAAMFGIALMVYFDLWYWYEKLILGGVIVAALIAALTFSVLQIDARGFPTRVWVNRSSKLRRVFNAVAEARAAQGLATRAGYQDFDNSEE